MPRNYVRSTLRASWSETDLDEAMKKVRQKEMGVNEAARTYNIPSRTLRRHILAGTLKVGLGRRPVFNQAEEKKLVAHIKQLEKVGFAPDRKDVKEMAYQLAHKLNIKNIFSNTSKKAGDVWFTGFLKRNPELSQRKSEGLSLARAYGVNRADVQDFFTLLAQIYTENDLSTHPEKIFNMDETGIQVNNKPSKVIATKGSKDVYTLTSSEKGENVTVIACCNAQGNFLPPVLIYKGTYSKPQFSEGLPPGSQVFMNKKSSYINTDLFMKWFEEIFLPAKGSGKALLIMDGHSSHSNNIRLLEVAKDNDVTLLCFPSHTTHAMQPLDRAFFRPFKVYFAQEAKSWMIMNKNKKLTRYDVSKLIGKAWCKAASVSNGVSALKSCGIYPYDPNAIPDHFFALSDALREQDLIANEQHAGIPSDTLENSSEQQNDALREQDLIANEQHAGIPSDTLENSSEQQNVDAVEVSLIDDTFDEDAIDFINQLTSDANKGESLEQLLTLPIQATPQKRPCLPSTSKTPDQTPTKVLAEIFPVPKLPAMILNKKQTAVILTSPENIQKRKLIEEKKKPAKTCKLSKKNDKKNVVKKDIKGKRPAKKKAKKNKPVFQSSDSDSEDENKKESSDEELSEEDNENRCVECTEDYYKTTSTEDWIKCSSCSFWLHEFCTMYKPLCNICGKKAKREKLSRRKK